MIRLIIFDIGGVIEDYTEQQYIRHICNKLKIDRDEFRDELLRILPSAEEGRISTREMLERVSLLFGINFRRLEWADSIRKLGRINPKMVDLVNRLHAKNRVILLTNVSKSRYMENVKFGFFKRVKTDRVYASCYLGLSKPGQQIYRYVLEKERVKPDEAVFIDNLEVNVKGARKVGMKGIHFVGHAKLVRDLKKLGSQVVACPTAWRGGLPGRWIAGPRMEDALVRARKINRRKISVLINYLGEDFIRKAEVQDAVDTYLKLITKMAEEKVKGDLSVKPTQIGLCDQLCTHEAELSEDS